MIAIWVAATIEGVALGGIRAASVELRASDTATIDATVGSASIAASFAGSIAVAVSVGVALAYNEIHNTVAAAILDADAATAGGAFAVSARTGGILLSATQTSTINATTQAASVAVATGLTIAGGGAQATNVILTKAQALITASDVESAADVSLIATDVATIDALVRSLATALGAGTVPGAVAIGVSIARNVIGFRQGPVTPTHTTHGEGPGGGVSANVVDLAEGDTVLVTRGARQGEAYRFLGSAAAQIDLSIADFADTDLWEQIGFVREPAEVSASISGSSLRASGALVQRAGATAAVTANVDSLAVALAIGANPAAAVAGAGVDIRNAIAFAVDASISDTRNTGVTTGGPISLTARDLSTIEADGGAAAAAAALGKAAVAAAIGVALATNEISSSVRAGTSAATVTSPADLTIDASGRAVATATSSTAAISAAFSFPISLAFSGAGARQDVTIATTTEASVAGGTLSIGGDLALAATDGSHAVALTRSLAVAVGLFSFAAGASVANTTVTPTVKAAISAAATVLNAASVRLAAVATGTSKAETQGVAFGTVLAVAASIAAATLAPVVEASISDSSVTSDGAITLEGRVNAAPDGTNAAVDADGVAAPNAAVASASASSGAVGAAGGGARATATDGGVVAVFADGGTLDAGGALSLLATSYAAPKATTTAIQAALGLVIGVALQTATALGSTRAQLGADSAEGDTVDVRALATMDALADGQAFGGAIGGAVNAVVSMATVEPNEAGDPSVLAGFGAGSVTATGAVTVLGELVAHASSPARGIQVGLGVAVGAAASVATVAPRVEVVSSGAIAGSSISLTGRLNADADEPTAEAWAQAVSGSIVGAGAGAGATATDSGIVDVHADGGGFTTAGPLALLAASYAAADATTTAITAAPGLVIGVAVQTATANGLTRAVMDADATASSVDVQALATMTARAEGQAFGGALVGAVNAVVSIATVGNEDTADGRAPSVVAGFGSGTVTSGPVTVVADLLAYATARTRGIQAAAGAAVGASAATATVTPKVEIVSEATVTAPAITFSAHLNATPGGTPVRTDAEGEGLPTALASAEAIAGSVGGSGSGAGATAIDGGIVDVHPDGGALSTVGALTVRAVSYATPRAETQAIAGSANVTLGVAAQTATANGLTRAVLGANVPSSGSIDVQAAATMDAYAEGRAFGGGLSAAVSSVVSVATVGSEEPDEDDEPRPASVAAGFGSGAVVSTGAVFVQGLLIGSASAPALAIEGAIGLRMGSAVSVARFRPRVDIVQEGGSVEGSSIDLIGLLNANSAGMALRTDDEGEPEATANATAQASGGSLLFSRAGAVARATDVGIVDVHPSAGTLSATGGSINLLAVSHVTSRATTLAIDPALGLSNGIAVQHAVADGLTRAWLGAGVLNAGGVTVNALSTMSAHAEGAAFGGALLGSVNAVVSTARVGTEDVQGDETGEDEGEGQGGPPPDEEPPHPAVQVVVGPGDVNAAVVADARLTSWATALAKTINVAVLVVGVAVARATHNPLVEAITVDGSASGGIVLRGLLNSDESGAPVRKDSGGQALPTAKAEAEAIAGGVLGAGAGARAKAIDGGKVGIHADTSTNASVTPIAASYLKAKADTKAIPVALLPVPVGVPKQEAIVEGAINISPRDNNLEDLPQARFMMMAAADPPLHVSFVNVRAISTMIADADGAAFGGGLLGSVNAVESIAKVRQNAAGDPSVFVSLGSRDIVSDGPVDVLAVLNASASARARAYAGGQAVAAGVALSTARSVRSSRSRSRAAR